jgi:hypothetical protein
MGLNIVSNLAASDAAADFRPPDDIMSKVLTATEARAGVRRQAHLKDDNP